MKLGDESHKSKPSMRDIVHLTNVKKVWLHVLLQWYMLSNALGIRNASLLFASPVQACI